MIFFFISKELDLFGGRASEAGDSTCERASHRREASHPLLWPPTSREPVFESRRRAAKSPSCVGRLGGAKAKAAFVGAPSFPLRRPSSEAGRTNGAGRTTHTTRRGDLRGSKCHKALLRCPPRIHQSMMALRR